MSENLLRLLLYLTILFTHPEPYTPEAMIDYANKMEPVYQAMGYPTNTGHASVSNLPNNVYGGTVASGGRCTARVYVGYKTITYPEPLWKYVLAHEWAHVSQGKRCVNNEVEATLLGLAVLAEAREWNALIYGVKWLGGQGKTETIEKILADSDGFFELKPNGTLDARKVWHLLNHLAQNPEHEERSHK